MDGAVFCGDGDNREMVWGRGRTRFLGRIGYASLNLEGPANSGLRSLGGMGRETSTGAREPVSSCGLTLKGPVKAKELEIETDRVEMGEDWRLGNQDKSF